MSHAAAPIPVTVVTGFLGAGKTTLVNRWLTGVLRGDVAVIVNELGNVGIDGALLAERVLELVEITGGCVCCATQADLVRALERITAGPSPPKRILVETSGAASPAGVVHAVSGSARHGAHVLDGIITVVDASRVDVLEQHELAIEQIGYADIIVLSHADRCDEVARERAASSLARHNGAAFIALSSSSDGDAAGSEALDALLERRRADFSARHDPGMVDDVRAHDRDDHRHVYESISLAIDGEVDEDRFADFMENELASFAGRLFRIKGILAVRGLEPRMIVQGVADLVEVTFGTPWAEAARTSRLVVVGFGLDEAALTRAFTACAVSERSIPPTE